VQRFLRTTSSTVHDNLKESPAKTVEKNSQTTIIVKPQNLIQSISKTKSDLLNEFDPIDPAVNIGKIKNLGDASVLLKCDNSDKITRLAKERVGISEDVTKDPLLTYLPMLNQFLFDNSSVCNVNKFCPTKKNDNIFQAAIEVDIATLQKSYEYWSLFGEV
jgi:hypothetical protein